MKKSIMLALRYCLAFALMLLLMAVLPVSAQTTTTYTVPEAAEVNKIYTSTNGAGWKDKQGWPLQMAYTTTGNTTLLTNPNGITFFYVFNTEPQLLISELKLYNNQLSGTIPNFSLPRLQVLFLIANQLSGTIPNFNLPNLLGLYLNGNQLSGRIPNFSLPNLKTLWLRGNQLSGSDVDWAKSPELTNLSLEDNKLVFRDLEPAAKAMQGRRGISFSYSPQDSVTTLKSNDTVCVDVGGEQTRYQWFRNGVAIINAIQASYKTTDTALYSCRSTNTLLPDLTLYSRPVRGGTVITSVSGTHLFQNGQTADIITALRIHPNPFCEQGSISYRLTSRVALSITVYSLLGQKLFTVFEGEQAAGTHVQELNMSAVSAGAYIVRMQAGASVQSVVVHYVR